MEKVTTQRLNRLRVVLGRVETRVGNPATRERARREGLELLRRLRAGLIQAREAVPARKRPRGKAKPSEWARWKPFTDVGYQDRNKLASAGVAMVRTRFPLGVLNAYPLWAVQLAKHGFPAEQIRKARKSFSLRRILLAQATLQGDAP